jgi:DNA-binding IclR family transcriptional regulator
VRTDATQQASQGSATDANAPARAPRKQVIEALDRGIDALELLAERGEVRLSELATELGVARATAFRILSTLQARGYVEHIAAEHTYRLGAGTIILAAQSHASSLIRLAEPAMKSLRDATGETINLALLRGGRLIYTEIHEGTHAMRMNSRVGEESPWHATALGKAVLSRLPVDEARTLLGPEPYTQYTAQTRTSWARLAENLRDARALGYAVDDEEGDFASVCVAAPILTRSGRPVAAISISGLAARFTDQARREIGPQLADWCVRISQGLGYRDEADGRPPEQD